MRPNAILRAIAVGTRGIMEISEWDLLYKGVYTERIVLPTTRINDIKIQKIQDFVQDIYIFHITCVITRL